MTRDTRATVIIGVDELLARLAAPTPPQLLDVRWRLGAPSAEAYGRYLDAHLPGAKFLDLENVLTGPLTDPLQGRHPLPDAGRLAAGLAALGVDPDSEIVVYDEPGSFAAGRAWWVLRWAGLDVRVLDGGLPAWVEAGGPLESGEARFTPSAGVPDLTTGHLPTLTADEAASFDGLLVDVRARERYAGEVEPIDARAGHIPGAVNRPVSGFWDASGRLPDEATLRARLALPEGERVAAYCGSGVSAAQVVLALASLGIEAPLYAPSWSGWSSDPSRPVEVGE